jgi:hypothetical protein
MRLVLAQPVFFVAISKHLFITTVASPLYYTKKLRFSSIVFMVY